MAFERFNKFGGIFKARVSISNIGNVSFNEGAREKLGLNKDRQKFAAVFYNKDSQEIGIHFLEEDDGNGVTNVRYREKGLDFSAKSFFEYYSILPEKTSFYEFDVSDGMVIIKLSTARERGGTRSDSL
ncbi:MAG: hypothetical protein FWG80_02125 [Alphaproteobacteria bacterium]|nr:hypothetical protein [Alphaproteobacteria bacterium]